MSSLATSTVGSLCADGQAVAQFDDSEESEDFMMDSSSLSSDPSSDASNPSFVNPILQRQKEQRKTEFDRMLTNADAWEDLEDD